MRGVALRELHEREGRILTDRALDDKGRVLILVTARILAADRDSDDPTRVRRDIREVLLEAGAFLGWDDRQVRAVVRDDLPHYTPPPLPARRFFPCEAPMVRRSGTCDHPVSPNSHLVVVEWSPANGTLVGRHFFCYRHREHAERLRRRLPRVEQCPQPSPNAGGGLGRHIWMTDWAEVYRWASQAPSSAPVPTREEARARVQAAIAAEDEDLDQALADPGQRSRTTEIRLSQLRGQSGIRDHRGRDL